jgi:hypothetical protein
LPGYYRSVPTGQIRQTPRSASQATPTTPRAPLRKPGSAVGVPKESLYTVWSRAARGIGLIGRYTWRRLGLTLFEMKLKDPESIRLSYGHQIIFDLHLFTLFG